MIRTIALLTLLIAFLSADGQAQTTLTISDSISVVGAVSDTDNGGSLVIQTDANGNLLNDEPPFTNTLGPGGVFDPDVVNANGTMGGANFDIDYQYAIRERANTAQQNRTVYSFLSFDVSALTVADVSDPTFNADFTIDYIGSLNILNGPGQYALGTPITAWDSTTNIPTTATGEAATLVPDSILITDSTTATAGSITVDITSLVQGWVDGSIANNGVTFIETEGTVNIGDDVGGPTTSQAGYFSNAVITTDFSGGTALCGDVDLSGTVDFDDISPFIEILANGGFSAEADCDESGVVDFDDIAPFISALAGP